MADTKKKSSNRNLNFFFIIGLILAILIIIFAIQNSDTTPVEFFRFEVNPPTALLIVACIALGSIMTLMFSIPGWFRRRKEKASLQSELKALRKNYEELAAVDPPKDPSKNPSKPAAQEDKTSG